MLHLEHGKTIAYALMAAAARGYFSEKILRWLAIGITFFRVVKKTQVVYGRYAGTQ